MRCTYVSPAKFCGTVHAVLSNAVNTLPPGKPPFVNEQNAAPVPVLVRARFVPAATAVGAAPVMVMVAKGVMARLLPVGQESMKPAAREKTLRIPSGVSKADGTAAALLAVRMKVWCLASTVTI